MSELDFEEEITTEESPSSLPKGSVADAELKHEMNGEKKVQTVNISDEGEPQITPKTLSDPEMSDGEIKSDTEVGKLSDLEEGEIEDSTPTVTNNSICRFFLRGACSFGSQCRYMHVGGSAYKMFENNPPKRVVNFVNPPLPSFPFPAKSDFPNLPPVANEGDNWDKALKEAKAMLLNAREKKETDVEFEDKKLFLSCEEGKTIKDTFKNSNGKSNFVEDRSKQKYKQNSLKSNEFNNDRNRIRKDEYTPKNKVRSQHSVDPWRRSRSRSQRSSSCSSFSSLSSGHHSCQDSSCSSRSMSRSPERKSYKQKHMSKLNRRYSKTVSRSRSRKRTRSWSLPYSSKSRSCSRNRSYSSSCSRSRSSSASRFSKIYSNEYLPPNSALNSNVRAKSSSRESKRRKLNSPSSEIKSKGPSSTLGWEMDSSDITVSCISCTSVSCSDSSDISDNDSASKREKVASCTSHHSNGLKETQNNYKENKNSLKNIHSSKKRKRNDEYFSDSVHLRKYSGKKFDSDNTLGELYDKSIELNRPVNTDACNKMYVHSTKSSEKQENHSSKKTININLKSKTVLEKSAISNSDFEEEPMKIKQPISRREQLLKQLQAVELAIAKKKHL